ncbi:sugar transferase [Pilimelia columellifera]|uniref:Sugar transferase n=1 Tax=Pilimelia columellifera subsp. columellifera TaxID=706583 RepID=A0ABP6AUX3_9ACTN
MDGEADNWLTGVGAGTIPADGPAVDDRPAPSPAADPGTAPAQGPAAEARSARRSRPLAPRRDQPRPAEPRRPRRVAPASRDRAAGSPRWQRRYVGWLLIVDATIGLVAGALTFVVRFGVDITRYHRPYLALSLLLPVALVGVLAMARAYEPRFLYVGNDEYHRVIRAGLGLTAAAAIASYAFGVQVARSYVLVALPAATLILVGGRYLIRRRLHRLRAAGRCLRRVLVVGHEPAVTGLTVQLRRERYHGLDVVGACLPAPSTGAAGLPPVYGAFDDAAGAVRRAGADTVIVLSCPELDGHALRRLAWQLEGDDTDLIVASALIDVAGGRTTIRPVDGLPMLHVEHPRLTGGAHVVKELVDRLGAALLLVALSPLLVGLAAMIRLDSPGPALFRQSRVGRHGQPFPMVKFRSMHVDAEARLATLRQGSDQDGVLFKMRDDPRVTPVGRWLRRFSLDELPQLFNVLRGEMSLVGPRPPLPAEVAVYPEDMRRRLVVKPGMTGLWQVSGRSDLPWEEAVRLDVRYVENWSLTLDLVIMLRTVSAVLRASGAY